MDSAHSSIPSDPALDAYASLLLGRHSSQRKVRRLRAEWVEGLPPERIEQLFELETLLRSMASFDGLSNHAGPTASVPELARDFLPELLVATQGMKRVVQLTKQLLGQLDRTFVFHQFVEGLLPENNARSTLATPEHDPDSPIATLLMLRRSFTHLASVGEGLGQLEQVGSQQFHSLLQLAQLQLVRNRQFNPLGGPSFYPEFDRIRSERLLDLLRSAPGSGTQRILARTFVTIFRLIRYLRLIHPVAGADRQTPAERFSRAYLVASVVNAEGQALARWLTYKAGDALARSFAQLVHEVPADQLGARFEPLRHLGTRFVDLRGAFESLAANLRLELRRFMKYEFPDLETGFAKPEDAEARIDKALVEFRPALQNLILFLIHSVGGHLEPRDIFDAGVERQVSERLRSHIWMFMHVVKAFIAKAQASVRHDDDWAPRDEFDFVFLFISYFRSIGYPLLRDRDIGSFRSYMRFLEHISRSTHISRDLLLEAIDASRAFLEVLEQLFDQIGRRKELQGVPFDPKRAARAVQLYLRNHPEQTPTEATTE